MAIPQSLVDLQERATAALLGAAAGDALGATLEFMTVPEIQAKYGVLRKMVGGGWLHLGPGQVTDDTQMSLCVARSLVSRGWSPHDLAERFADWFRQRPVDIGNTCRRGIARYINSGQLWSPPGDGDAGNGAAMRMAPVALATLGDTSLLDRIAVEQAHLTHNHPLSDAACLLVGRLVQQACLGRSMMQLRRVADETIVQFRNFKFEPYRGLATAYVVDTIQTVLHFFFTTSTFEDCVVATVNQGADADTTGAIVGAIAGAYYSRDEIPRAWIKKMDSKMVAELNELALTLVTRSPLGQSLKQA